MDRATRRTKDQYVRDNFPDVITVDAVVALVVETKKQFYGPRATFSFVYLYVFGKYMKALCQSDKHFDIMRELRKLEKERSLELKIEPEYYI